MKVRSDFVSNSSSSSFIVAINKEYDIKSFSKDLAKACINKKAEYHNPKLEARNRMILEFCLNMYQASFVGMWKMKDVIEDIVDKKKLHVDYSNMPEEADRIWNNCMSRLERRKNSKEFIDTNGAIHLFYDAYASFMPVEEEVMCYSYGRYGLENDDAQDKIKFRIEELKKRMLKQEEHEFCYRTPDVFSITKDSVKNTRQLIEAGEDIDLGNLNLDDLDRRLDAGEKIFGIRIARNGDGYGTYYVYQEDGAEANIDSLAMEYLDSECM